MASVLTGCRKYILVRYHFSFYSDSTHVGRSFPAISFQRKFVNTATNRIRVMCDRIRSGTSVRRCSRCRNHGMLVELKGHKNSCQYQDCSCQACTLLDKKKEVCRQAIALRRRQDKGSLLSVHVLEAPPGCYIRQHPYRSFRNLCISPSLEEAQVTVTLPRLQPAPNYLQTTQAKTPYDSHMRRYMDITRNRVPGIVSQSVDMTRGTNTAPFELPPGLRQSPYVQPRPCHCEPTYTTLKPVSHVGLHYNGSAPSFNHILSMPPWMENPLWYGQEQVPYRPWMPSQYIAPPADESQNKRM